jgi:SagB-type dehydrogenase family enzyme
MQGKHAIESPQLHHLLQFVSRRHGRTATRERLPRSSLSLAVRINRVAGYERGAYVWNAETETLELKTSSDLAVWQSTYAMQNYNIDQTACILFVIGRLGAVLDCYGPRGYRVLNAYVGMTAQMAYLAAAALGLDCGAVLGVRAQHLKKTLQLDPDQNVFLAVFLSRAQQRTELFRFQIAPDIPVWNPLK